MPSRREKANRRNAAKSTGPRTKAGIMRSSLNAVTHGLTSANAVLAGEDPDQLTALEVSLASQYRALPVAQALCAQYASVLWRLARLRRLEAISLAVSDVGRILGSLATNDGEDSVTIKDLSIASEEQCRDLRIDMRGLIERMGNLSRYEAMLFAQLVRLTEMLDPYRLESSEQLGLPPPLAPESRSQASAD
jgi:hypothetical protein